jgi:hypothetical protein
LFIEPPELLRIRFNRTEILAARLSSAAMVATLNTPRIVVAQTVSTITTTQIRARHFGKAARQLLDHRAGDWSSRSPVHLCSRIGNRKFSRRRLPLVNRGIDSLPTLTIEHKVSAMLCNETYRWFRLNAHHQE